MNWEEYVELNKVEKRTPDSELARSLLKIAGKRFEYFYTKDISVFSLEGVYEAVLELCHALMTYEGLKTLSHECAIEYLRNRYLDDYETEFLQKLRKKRHGIKYYGNALSEDTIVSYIEKTKTLFQKLKEITEKKLDNKL